MTIRRIEITPEVERLAGGRIVHPMAHLPPCALASVSEPSVAPPHALLKVVVHELLDFGIGRGRGAGLAGAQGHGAESPEGKAEIIY